MDAPPQNFSPHPRVEALVWLLPTRRAGSRRMEWDGGRHAARCEARGARNLVCGSLRRRQAQARSHGAAPAVAGTLAAGPCAAQKMQKKKYYTSKFKFNGAPLNARRCRPRLAGAQGAHYANARELSCHTRGVLRGHYDTMSCPTGLPSGARRCWVPLA